MNRFILLILFLFSFIQLNLAQEENNTNSKKKIHEYNPKKAVLFASFVPSGGQIYNRKYWKAPIAIGGYIGLVYLIKDNTAQYKLAKYAYELRVDGDENTIDTTIYGINNIKDEAVKTYRDKYRTKMETSYFYLVAYHGLVILDAFVDAQLSHFDISDDLSLDIMPKSIINNSLCLGSGLFLNF